MILEGIVASLDAGGKLNVAPMGPIVEPDMSRLVLRPFRTSQTYRNLKQRPAGVFHVVDDVLLLAKGAIGRIDPPPETFPAERIDGRVLRSACRWYEFEIESLDDSRERTEIIARIVHTGRLRDVFGFNRAKHAVLEAAILATRLHLLPRDEILRQYAALKVAVEKTAGPRELEAFALLEQHVATHSPDTAPVASGPTASTEVRIRTGARLHFGPLAVGAESGRQFGGVGMMIESPGFTIAARSLPHGAAGDLIEGPPDSVEAIRRAVDSYRRTIEPRVPFSPVRIAAEACAPAHAGFGSGTQLALAVGRALSQLEGRSLEVLALAERVGRGARSAIGIHGFDRGGLLVDGGKRTSEEIGTLVARAEVPDWRIVLITPPGEPGLSGPEERQAFARLRPMSSAVTERLCRLALLDLLPAIQDADFQSVAAALFEYGSSVGEYFAPAQGGIYAHAAMRGLVPRIRSAGFEGVGQTSWGPSLFVLVPDDDAAARVRGLVERDSPGCRLLTTHPANHGAVVESVGS